jgi:membrane-bound inhibitor of C-type lysozyme
VAQATGSLATAADVVALTQDARARFALFSFSGTYGSAVVKFEAQLPGSSVWVPVPAVALANGARATGSLGLTDNGTVGYIVLAPGALKVRAYLVSIVSGSVTVASASDDSFGTFVVPDATTTAAIEVASADGAIATKNGSVVITKGTAAALTLAAPSAGADDGKRLQIVSATAAAHTVTQTTPGINNGGTASDVATFTAAIGNGMELMAYNGIWYTVSLRNVTLA